MLNPNLDVRALSQAFRARNRLMIRDILTPDAAEAVYSYLTKRTPWGLAFHDETKAQSIDASGLQAMSAEQKQILDAQIFARATSSYQYRYHYYSILQAYLQRRDPGSVFDTLLATLNSPQALGMLRTISGLHGIIRADAQATLYAPGDYLFQHEDKNSLEGWLVAYVIGFSKEWSPNWGGMLQFYSEQGDVIEGFLPRFNTMTIFAVPQKHAVTYVPPYAPVGRYSVTGWFSDHRGVPEATRKKLGLL